MDSIQEIRSKLSVTPGEAAKLISESRDNVITMIHKKEIPYYKNGNRFLIPVFALEKYVKQKSGME